MKREQHDGITYSHRPKITDVGLYKNLYNLRHLFWDEESICHAMIIISMHDLP